MTVCTSFFFFLIRGPVCSNMWAAEKKTIVTKTTANNTKLPTDTVAFFGTYEKCCHSQSMQGTGLGIISLKGNQIQVIVLN